jgi:hypothetical protein
MEKKILKVIAAVAIVASLAAIVFQGARSMAQDASYNTAVYFDDSGNRLAIKSGGTLQTYSGSRIDASAATLKLPTGSVTSTYIGDAEVTTAKLCPAAVTSAKIGASEVVTAAIAAAAVTTPKLGVASVTSAKIGDGEVVTVALAAGAVTTAKIASNAVTTGKLYFDFPSGTVACFTTGKLLGRCTSVVDAYGGCGCN